MARTPLFARLRHQLRLALAAEREGLSIDEVARRDLLSRRELLRGAGAVAAAPLVAAFASACEGGSSGARVAVIGGGLAGLHAAYRLARLGVDVDVYEASSRSGGRTFTARGMLAGDQLCELGGELIDSGHATMHALVEELGLRLDDRVEAPGVRAETFFFGGRVVPEEEILAAWAPVAPLLAAALEGAESNDATYATLDETTMRDWLADHVADETLRAILDVAYVGEYGRETDRQSVLNLVYLIGSDDASAFHVFGVSDERYHIHEGSDAIASAMAAELGERVRLEHRVTALAEGSAGGVRVSATGGAGATTEDYDRVIVATPFSTLRNVEIGLPLSEDKRAVIDELQYGTNAKLMLQLTSKPWRQPPQPASGAGFADNGAQTFWETSIGQDGDEGILTHFVGGDRGVEIGDGTPESQAAVALPLLDAVFPGVQTAYGDRALRMHWPTVPTVMGSYSCYAPGQWAYYGVEGEAEGLLHFCGEHTSLEFQGYMEGAAETGLRAAMEVADALGLGAITAPLVDATAHRPRSRLRTAFRERARRVRALRRA